MSRLIFKSALALLITSALSLSGCDSQNVASSGQNTVVSGKASIGGNYSLIDHNGNAVTQADYVGKPQLIYFGYAFCPDVCPTALQQMGAALSLSGKAAEHYQPLFITIDSERDTPEQLALYVTANGFPKNLIGLTGSPEQLKAAMKTFAVIGMKITDEQSASGYTYDHSSLIYMMDAQGEFVDIFTHADTPAKIAERLIAYKKTGH